MNGFVSKLIESNMRLLGEESKLRSIFFVRGSLCTQQKAAPARWIASAETLRASVVTCLLLSPPIDLNRHQSFYTVFATSRCQIVGVRKNLYSYKEKPVYRGMD